MYKGQKVSAVIPCYNEQEGIADLLKDKPSFIDEIIVVDNNSTDHTSSVASGAMLFLVEIQGSPKSFSLQDHLYAMILSSLDQ